jgi:uncharacterized protein YqeY
MMTLRQRLQDDLIRAMRDQDETRKRTLRLALTAVKLKEKEKESGRELTDADVAAVLQKEAKQRRETLDDAARANRPDLIPAEQAELDILTEFLPKQLSRDDITDLARQVIADLKAEGPRATGQVMRTLMAQLKGQADGQLVSQIVRELLSN